MAWENTSPYITVLPTTGLRQFHFVTVNTAGLLAYPAVGARAIGVLVSNGTTNSTVDPVKGATVQIYGVAKLEAITGTAKAASLIQSSSIGYAMGQTGAGHTMGICVAGTTGGTGRMMSVLLRGWGTT